METSKRGTNYLTEDFVLLLKEDKTSDFLPLEKYRSDSIKTAMLKRIRQSGGEMILRYGKTIHNEIISKDLTSKKIIFEKQLFDKLFAVDENCPMEWKIIDGQENYLNFPAQKATTEFGGRSWTAWFTGEIPIADGPYKFHGLPGLIVKIEDATGEYAYRMTGLTAQSVDISERNFGNGQPIKIGRTKRNEIWERYKKEPSSVMGYQESSLDGGWTTKAFVGGNPNDPAFRRNFDQKQREHLRNFENPIEPKPSCK